MSDKIDFKTKRIIREREGSPHNDKISIHQDNLVIQNMLPSNKSAQKYMKQNITEKCENPPILPYIPQLLIAQEQNQQI